MRIGLLIYGDIESISGGYLYNRKLVSNLKNQGYDVQIIELPMRGYWHNVFDNFNDRLLSRILGAKVDVLIQDAMVHPSVFLLNYRLRKRIMIPVIALVHLLTTFDYHPFYRRWYYRLIEQGYFNSVTGMIINSQTTLAQIKELIPTPIAPYCVAVPAGDNFSNINNDSQSHQRKCFDKQVLDILVVGNVIRRKGLHILIHALRELADDCIQVTVVGRLDMEPRYVAKMKQLVIRFQLQGQVTFKGVMQGDALATAYQENHLMVLPSAYESYGIVYVEALQFGLPVIGTSSGAAKEIIQHGDNGYLIPPENPHSLAVLLKTLQKDRELLSTLSQNALISYAHHPRWTDSCEIIRKFIHAHSNLLSTQTH